MKLLDRRITAIFILMSVSACAKPQRDQSTFADQDQDAIVNGRPVHNKDELSHSIVALVSQTTQGEALCTGTLLAKDTVLTAAHCVEGKPERIAVIFAHKISNLLRDGVRIATRYIQNPRWKHPTRVGKGDLALIHFEGGIPSDYEPVLLAKSDFHPKKGTESIFMGYGVTNGGTHQGSGLLRVTQSEILGSQSPTEIVTDGRTTSVCFGDSGGPAFSLTGDHFVQWGVASSVTSGYCNEASIHTAVMGYLSWIRSTAARLRRY